MSGGYSNPTIPATMKAAVVEEFGKSLVIKSVPVPEPGHGEVLVKVIASGPKYEQKVGHFKWLDLLNVSKIHFEDKKTLSLHL